MEAWWVVLIAAGVALAAGAALLLLRRRRAGRRAVTARPEAAGPTPADRLRKGLEATRRRLAARLDRALGTGSGDADAALSEIEEALVEADVGVRTAAELMARI